MKHVIIFPTFRCGAKCPYCAWNVKDLSGTYAPSKYTYEVKEEVPKDDLIKILNTFHPSTFEFSGGGEPLRYKGIAKVINSLPNWSITSNTLHNLEGLDLSKCYWWTASFHPHLPKKAKEKFIQNIQLLKDLRVNLGITLVVKPDTLSDVEYWASYFKEKSIHVNIHPYYDDPNFNWNNYPEAAEWLRKNRDTEYNNMMFEYKGLKGAEKCEGGKEYFFIGPDGRVWRCLTAMVFGWDKNLTGVSTDTYNCAHTCIFPCDWKYGMKYFKE